MNLLADATASWLTADGRVRLNGSGHAAYVLQHLTAAFSQLHPQVRFAIELHGTPSAMAFASNGKALLSVMGREITPIESIPWCKQHGAAPLGVRVARAERDTRQHLATSLAVYVDRSKPQADIDTIQLALSYTGQQVIARRSDAVEGYLPLNEAMLIAERNYPNCSGLTRGQHE